MIPVLYAAGSAPAKGGGALGGLLPIILMFVIFYLLLIVPQQKKAKKHKEMLSQLKVGDEVVTASGIFGKIKAIKEDAIELQIADKTVIRILKGTISQKTVK